MSLEIKVDYKLGEVSRDYFCAVCGVRGVKLWRDYNVIADRNKLTCVECSTSSKLEIDQQGFHKNENGWYTDQIDYSKVPAIPCEDDDTYWGYTSVPHRGIDWWRALPNKLMVNAIFYKDCGNLYDDATSFIYKLDKPDSQFDDTQYLLVMIKDNPMLIEPIEIYSCTEDGFIIDRVQINKIIDYKAICKLALQALGIQIIEDVR